MVAFGALMIAAIVLYTYLQYRRKIYQQKSNDIDDIANAASVRSIMSRQEIVFSAKVDKEVDNFVQLNNKSKLYTLQSEKPDYWSNVALESTGPIISFVFVGFIIYQNISGQTVSTIDVAALVFLIYFASRFTELLYHTVWMIKKILDFLPQVEKFWKLLDETPNLTNYEKGDTFVQKNISIVFEDVNFAYGDKKVLEKFSLTIPCLLYTSPSPRDS